MVYYPVQAFLEKPHLRVEEGKAMWEYAYLYEIEHWNEAVENYKR